MNRLKKYVATVLYEDKDRFLDMLSVIGKQSGVHEGNRLSLIHDIISEADFTVLGVSLSDNELIIMKLSCPGKYVKEEIGYQ